MSVAEDAKAEAIRVETVASGVADTMVDLNGPVSEEQLDAIAGRRLRVEAGGGGKETASRLVMSGLHDHSDFDVAAASTHGASEGVI